jgi:paired amphipathic helix protein Sin3a
MLFHGNPLLIQGFNTFLPQGYRIDVSADPHDPNTIKVTTPMGTTTQTTNSLGHFTRSSRDAPVFGPPGMPPYTHSVPVFGNSPRPITPHSFNISHGPPVFDATYSPSFHGQSTTAAASFLGNLSNKYPVEQQPATQFNHAIQYLNKIKARYGDDPNTYKQFLEILQTYQKEQKYLQDVGLFLNVTCCHRIHCLSKVTGICPGADAIQGCARPTQRVQKFLARRQWIRKWRTGCRRYSPTADRRTWCLRPILGPARYIL